MGNMLNKIKELRNRNKSNIEQSKPQTEEWIQYNKNKSFFEAVQKNDLQEVVSLYDDGANPNGYIGERKERPGDIYDGDYLITVESIAKDMARSEKMKDLLSHMGAKTYSELSEEECILASSPDSRQSALEKLNKERENKSLQASKSEADKEANSKIIQQFIASKNEKLV